MKIFITLAICLICLGVYSQDVDKIEKNIILKSINEGELSKINKGLSIKYGQKKADSIILNAKAQFFWNKKDYALYVKEFIKSVELNQPNNSPSDKNSSAWRVFDYATDMADLKVALNWISEAQNYNPSNEYFLDTYANILYKLGKTKPALGIQKMAVTYSRLNPTIIENYFKMRAGLPTWKYPVSSTARNEKAEEQIWTSIRQEFSREVDSLIWSTRLIESKSFEDKTKRTGVLIRYVREVNPKRSSAQLNEHAWTVFECSNKKSQLNTALQWSKESLTDVNAKNRYQFLDTYANILLKLGRQKEAVKWSEQALSLAPENEKTAYKAALEKIIKGE